MLNYVTKDININDLILDENNPRFIIPPNPSQQSIVDYLIDYEEVEQLAMDISKSGGLYAGERVIAVKENGKYVVLEGNRRICACKILMNPRLLQNRRPASINKLVITDNLINNISNINVDVMPSRISAQSSLAAKHIDGIKKWSTISKYKFFALEFDAGRTIDEIALVTGVSQSKIRSGLKEYRVIQYVLNLQYWTQKQKEEYLNLQDIKTSRLTRLFSAKTQDKKNPRLRDILDLSYDDNFYIQTALDKDIFDKILYIVAQAAFIPDYCVDFNGTRSTYEDIPELMNYLAENKILIESRKEEKQTLSSNDLGKKETTQITSKESDVENKNDLRNKEKNKKENKNDKKYTSNRNVLIPDDFMVSCKMIKINDIINELKRLNLNYSINAQAVLLRVLVELSLKYYLNNVNESGKIIENNLEGTFNATLESMRVKKIISLAEHSNLNQIRKNDKIFSIFNGYVHYDSVLPNKNILIYYFDNMRKILEICLNS
ncbi:hypothetical protein GCM10023142_21550 [Anaerocolumna aminovalerica]|uniref:ParB-like nuclease domain-containing protein n=1 Tax=Anaerocolumna aminovalerica TaxID=1527 RepID=A0A1I5D9R1_9FIRM|nr:ParB/Srx family N-terminal domain-containing protein [Anaerocolumna aminovalerica]SFN95965.1 hypothetical protein SAMN04489757_10582 [Anaerocolumna aminovalerica]